ncbi:MAG TPA: chitobiase/beta-hexosaminidase C-terminal domain-containing protein [Gemmatimonadaceae bacterium]|nr:chitobiase/beta-hexosaminidase C-terminal domain-containing protein [Gemmatimonadaceae bacterium]
MTSSGPHSNMPGSRRKSVGEWRAVLAFGGAFLVAACSTSRPAAAPPPAPVAQAPVPAPAPPAPAPAAWKPANARLLTKWATQLDPEKVLPEYPRPQMVRERWQNLNGLWQFAVVADSSAAMPFGRDLSERILVPFAMESSLSGIGRHADRVVYRRTFTPPSLAAGERLLLHFGAVDWQTHVFVNGKEVGFHSGGYDPFSFDITDALRSGGQQELVVDVFDPTDKFGQPRGKQVSEPEGIWYTPVTGIWQTVWLEPVPPLSIESLRMTPDVDGGALKLTVRSRGSASGSGVDAVVMSNGKEIARASGAAGSEIRIPVANAHLWSADDPFLYDLRVSLRAGSGTTAREVDRVESYFGMRKVGLVRDSKGRQHIALNGKAVFQLGPLDQGWWPDGLYTAPTDEALRSDIETMKALGFNMVRKHIKVEPARWYYYADKLGLPIWQDMPSGWNDSKEAQRHFESELRAMLENRHNSPSIVVWVPFNEKWGQFDTPRIVGIIKSLDQSRLVNDVSGWQHSGAGDIVDVHRYQGPQAMLGTKTQTAVVGEFGGLGYKLTNHTWAGEAWGYGGLYKTEEELHDRYDLLMKRMWHLRDTHGMSAGVYTQLTDVEVELNGFMTYDRLPKFDSTRTAAVNRGLAPYILPEYPEFTNAVVVSITQGRPTQIRYTTDGSEPTAASALYKGPFTIRGNTTVRARSFDHGTVTHAPEARTEYKRVAGRAPAAATGATVAPGLSYAFFRDTTYESPFRMNWPVRDRVDRLEPRNGPDPAKTGTVPNFSLAPSDTSEMFGIMFTGYIRVPRTGVYTFTSMSDDGARLWIGNETILASLGQSPATTETQGQIALQAGLHPISLGYFQAYGPKVLELFIEGPGMPRQRISGQMLYHARSSARLSGGSNVSATARLGGSSQSR